MKLILQGTHGRSFHLPSPTQELIPPAETDSSPEAVSQLVSSMVQEDFFYALTHSLHLLPFEARKDSQSILSNAFRFRPPGATADEGPALAHVIDQRSEVIVELCRGYDHKESSMPCGVVLREILKFEHVTAIILHDQSQGDEPAVKASELDLGATQSGEGIFWKFFSWIDKGAFEVSTDAFTTFRVSPTRQYEFSIRN